MRFVTLLCAAVLIRLGGMIVNGSLREIDSAVEPILLMVQMGTLVLVAYLAASAPSAKASLLCSLIAWIGGSSLAAAILLQMQPQSIFSLSLVFQIAETAPAILAVLALDLYLRSRSAKATLVTTVGANEGLD